MLRKNNPTDYCSGEEGITVVFSPLIVVEMSMTAGATQAIVWDYALESAVVTDVNCNMSGDNFEEQCAA